MKILTTLFLLFVGFTTIAQRSSYRQDIHDTGKQLVIRVDGAENGKEFHFSKSFDILGMSDEEKSALIRRVLESVRFGEEDKSDARTAASWKEAGEPTWSETPEPKGAVASIQAAVPFTKLVEEDTVTQRIKVSYQYVRNGEEHSYERTINKQGKTREEIEKLIEETEESIGFAAKNS